MVTDNINMITEDYVNFETAKLLKEKGFNEGCRQYWYRGNLVFSRSEIWNRELDNYEDEGWTAPTLQMAMKWLRDVQGLNIYALGVWKDVEVQYCDWEPVVVGYNWFVESLMDDTYSKMSIEQFLTYEQACEAAIKYCLENLV